MHPFLWALACFVPTYFSPWDLLSYDTEARLSKNLALTRPTGTLWLYEGVSITYFLIILNTPINCKFSYRSYPTLHGADVHSIPEFQDTSRQEPQSFPLACVLSYMHDDHHSSCMSNHAVQ